MKRKIKQLLIAALVVMGIILNACGSSQNQMPTQQLTLTLATSTPVPMTPTVTSTITPTVTPTSWISVLLTTTPTRYPLPTLPPDCGMVKLSNAGTQVTDNAQNILVQGSAIICGQIYIPIIGSKETIAVLESMIDLDMGAFNLEDADLWFCPGGGSMIFYGFCNANNSYIVQYSLNGLTMENATEPTFSDCQSITEDTPNASDNEPEYACVITNLGNISRIKIEQYNPLEDVMSLEISFITWGK